MFLSRKMVLWVTVAEIVAVVAAVGAGYYFGNKSGYQKGCEHSFFLIGAYNNPVEVATKDLEETCNLLRNKRAQAQELLDEAQNLVDKK